MVNLWSTLYFSIGATYRVNAYEEFMPSELNAQEHERRTVNKAPARLLRQHVVFILSPYDALNVDNQGLWGILHPGLPDCQRCLAWTYFSGKFGTIATTTPGLKYSPTSPRCIRNKTDARPNIDNILIQTINPSLPKWPPNQISRINHRFHEALSGSLSDKKGYVFCHNYISQPNIIVDPKTLEIRGTVDWEYAGCMGCGFGKGWVRSSFGYPLKLKPRWPEKTVSRVLIIHLYSI